ncbi:DUF1444 domain-containing protein [Texcoconibacillus texcoconensis]|uniref:Uncharacterized protein YtpQ (UPF0354 family) n=1 Tax=Texcoconibacillus texcoconensis TaxID=1095777 RepID=A0A840QN27_9BACI|nr:DUF1444 domain-containing protein [Texcoconibacillus texcoconensis]MBB5172785.1 uncharacterized protein YtpQ (UPF0354 family) [Texcoconibacillus texcoconensis]
MKPIEIKRLLEEHLQEGHWMTSYDKDAEKLRIVDKTIDKGVTISLPPLTEKFKEDKEGALQQVVHDVREALTAMTRTVQLTGNESNIYPVLRAPSFPTETDEGETLVYEEHTAESRIYYAYDHGKTYTLINESMLEKEGVRFESVKEAARFNIRSLPQKLSQDEVAGNTFYFLNTNDGYDASRILDERLLQKMASEVEGTLTVAIPHQDVLIFGDIINERGYDVLAQMVFQFFSEGRVPITALPFIYEEGDLEPIFILAQKKPQDGKQ